MIKLSKFDNFLSDINEILNDYDIESTGKDYPAKDIAETSLSESQKKEIVSLMRVNHSGEVAAQGLYRGQALTARLEGTRDKMDRAAQEELDHLSWCNKRLDELNERPSFLSPLWYGLSFGMGAIAGAAGDKWSLGFVHETEHQVVKHLEDHLNKLSPNDAKTIAILKQMKLDEANHSEEALSSGAEILPDGIKSLMSVIAKVMTKTSYYI